MNEINRLEKDSILYYQGGGANVTLTLENQNLREFYDVDNSYMVINALLMPGVSNERVRLKEEGRQVALVMFEHMDEMIAVYCRLYSAMCKYTCYYEGKKMYHTYRADRMNTLNFLEHGQMYSFMSTQKSNDNNTNFHDKNGILLLEVETQGDIEYIDVNAVLREESIYPHEHEILFAPFTLLDKESLEMTEEEKSYEDINGNPPEAKYLLHLRLSSVVPCRSDCNEKYLQELYTKIMEYDSMVVIRQVWETFMNGREPEEDIVKLYVEWKEKLQIYLRLCFAGIKYNVMYGSEGEDMCIGNKQETGNKQNENTMQGSSNIQDYQKQMNELEGDVRKYYWYTDVKRVKYRNRIRVVNVAMAVLYPLTTLFVALSFQENLQEGMRIASLLSSAIGTIIPMIAKGLAWNENFQQRTATYLKLDELLRDIHYEKSVNEDSMNRYIEYFKRIVCEDDEMGLENAGILGKNQEKMLKEFKQK